MEENELPMKLDYCYYCEGFVSIHKYHNVCLILLLGPFGLFFSKRICNHCGNRTYKRLYERNKE